MIIFMSNDTVGHVAGKAITEMQTALERQTGFSQFLYRLGGQAISLKQ